MKVKACHHDTHHLPAKERFDWALGKLRELQLRVTNPRKDILSVLTRSERPLSSEDIFSQLKKGSSDLVTVYRNLTALEEFNLLRRHDLGDGVRRYELAQEQNHHHHYIRCRDCGSVEAFEGCQFEKAILKLLERKGYKMIQHNLDVQALCSACVA